MISNQKGIISNNSVNGMSFGLMCQFCFQRFQQQNAKNVKIKLFFFSISL